MKHFKALLLCLSCCQPFHARTKRLTWASIWQSATLSCKKQSKTQQLDELNGVIATIATGLDSIAVQEHIYLPTKEVTVLCLVANKLQPIWKAWLTFWSVKDKDTNAPRFIGTQEIIARCGASAKVVEFLNQQLAEKDKVIQTLRADLNNSKRTLRNFARPCLICVQERAAQNRKQRFWQRLVKTRWGH